MGRPAPKRMGLPRRTARRLWPDRNPLRRATDRVEAALAVALIVVFVAVAPLLSLAAWHWAADAGHRAAAAQQATSHQVSAVTLKSAPPPVFGAEPASLVATVPARWVAPGGAVHTGTVAVAGGMRAGSKVTVWLNKAGQLTSPPLQPAQVNAQAAQAAAGAPFGLVLLLGGIWLVIRRALNRRRLAAWEAGWAAFGPRWTRRRLAAGPSGHGGGKSLEGECGHAVLDGVRVRHRGGSPDPPGDRRPRGRRGWPAR